MSYCTLGSLIQEARKNSKTITRKKLAYGICSEQTLFEIETNQCMPDILMLDILLQRLGQSPDKLEIIINADNYKMVRMRDLLETTILRKKRERATQILQKYPSRSKIDKMYRCRMQASLYYYIDKNITGTIEYLKKAIHTTLPKFSYENIESFPYRYCRYQATDRTVLLLFHICPGYFGHLARKTNRPHRFVDYRIPH